jgi:CRISPR/Cas system-associated exonuclease Cas4 (RecB family)
MGCIFRKEDYQLLYEKEKDRANAENARANTAEQKIVELELNQQPLRDAVNKTINSIRSHKNDETDKNVSNLKLLLDQTASLDQNFSLEEVNYLNRIFFFFL